MVGICHCSRCRKVGSSTYAYVRAEAFSWVAGRGRVKRYRPPPPFAFDRCFCKTCGTALGDPFGGRILAISADCLDDELGLVVDFHEYRSDRPAWRRACRPGEEA